MKKLFLQVWLLAGFFLLAAGPGRAQDGGDRLIRQDDKFIVGKLDNGLTYYIRKAQNPPRCAEFFIAHNVGSLQEEDNQRGLAHFLEHMAFNGTRNFPGKGLLNYLGSIGVKFGNNVNAYTSMDRTVYNISAVPVVRDGIIDSVLLMLHDWSYYISCEPEEIEAERGVIREEWRRGDDARSRLMKHMSALEQTGSRFAERGVIGLMDVVNNFKPQTLIDFYHKWYRPDLQAIFIVGDIDPLDIEKRVKKIFSSIPKAQNPAPRLTYSVPDNLEPIIDRYTDPELKASSVRIIVKFPQLKGEEKLKESYLKDKLETDLMLEMIRRRTTVNADEGKALYKIAIPSMGAVYYDTRLFRIVAVAKKNDFEKALAGILSDYEILKKYGFAPGELAEAVQGKRAKLLKERNMNRNLPNRAYVNLAIEHFTRGEALPDADAYYEACFRILDEITAEDVNAFVARNFSDKNLIVSFEGKAEDLPAFSSDERVKFLIDSIRRADLPPYEYVPQRVLTFDRRLAPAALPQETPYPGIPGAVRVRMPSGNKVIWIENPDKPASISFRAVREGGYSSEPDSRIFESRLMKMYLNYFMVNGMKRNEFTAFCNNNRISVRPDMNSRYDMWAGSFAGKNAELFFQALYQSMADVKTDRKAFENLKKNLIKKLSEEPSPMKAFSDSCGALLYLPNILDDKFTREILDKITENDVLEAYNRHFSTAEGYTFIFEGAMSYAEAKPLLEKYLANLPQKAEAARSVNPVKYNRGYVWRKGTVDLRYGIRNTANTKATVEIQLRGNYDYTPEAYNCSRFLSLILQDRYTRTIREERGGTYHVGVSCKFSQHPHNYVTLSVDFETEPRLADELVGCVWTELYDLAENVPSRSEMEKIKAYLNKTIAGRPKSEIAYIGKAVAEAAGEVFVDRYDPQAVNAVTAKDVRNFARKLMKQKNRSVFIAEPVSVPE